MLTQNKNVKIIAKTCFYDINMFKKTCFHGKKTCFFITKHVFKTCFFSQPTCWLHVFNKVEHVFEQKTS